MDISPQKQKEAAYGLTYAIKRLKHTIKLTKAVDTYWGGEDHVLSISLDRLNAIELTLRRAGNLLDMHSKPQFGEIGLDMVERATKDDNTFISTILAGDGWNSHVASVLSRVDKAIVEYQLQYPILHAAAGRENPSSLSNSTEKSSSNKSSDTFGDMKSSGSPRAPPPTWIWDQSRSDYYRYNPIDNCYVYASGLVLDADFSPIQGQRKDTNQLPITSGRDGVEWEDVD